MRKSTKICAALGVVAGLGVAVAPLSAFADTPTRTDTLNVNITEACTVNGKTLSQEDNTANVYDVDLAAGEENVMTRRTTGEGGNATEQTFTIRCNSATGYRILATGTALTGQDTANRDASIPAADPVSGTSYWAAGLTATGNLTSDLPEYTAITTTGQRVAHNNAGSAAAGDSFTVNYKAGVSTAQKAGHYQGTVTYTLMTGAE